MVIEKILEYVLDGLKFGLAVLILVLIHEFGHFLAARKMGVRVETFSMGFGKKLFIWKKKRTDYVLSAIPLGGYVKLAGDNIDDQKGAPDEFLSKSVGKRFAVIFSGPLMNYILAIVFFWMVFFLGFPYYSTKVGAVKENMGAMQAGIKAGDKIIAVEGRQVKIWDELSTAIRANSDKETVKITLLRDNQEQVFSVSIRQHTAEDALKQKRKIGMIGISPDPEDVIRVRYGFFRSFNLGIKMAVDMTVMTYRAFGYIISRQLPLGDSVTGPIGLWDFFASAKTLPDFMHLIAILSLSLAIFNLLPFPALDGGHILLLGIEKLRGRYLSQKVENIVGQLGMGFILLLAAFVTYNDLDRKGVISKSVELIKKPFINTQGAVIDDRNNQSQK
jgi:regulator of sigma E protease